MPSTSDRPLVNKDALPTQVNECFEKKAHISTSSFRKRPVLIKNITCDLSLEGCFYNCEISGLLTTVC